MGASEHGAETPARAFPVVARCRPHGAKREPELQYRPGRPRLREATTRCSENSEAQTWRRPGPTGAQLPRPRLLLMVLSQFIRSREAVDGANCF